MDKKGLSNIIVVLILILLTLVAVAILWIVYSNITEDKSNITIEPFLVDIDIDPLSVQRVNYEDGTTNISLKIIRNPGEGNIDSLKFIIFDGTLSHEEIQETNLEELTERIYLVPIGNLNNNTLKTITVVPILLGKDGKKKTARFGEEYNFETGKTRIIDFSGGGTSSDNGDTPPIQGNLIQKVDTYGNFISGGVEMRLNTIGGNETGRLFYKKNSETFYREGHPFVRYDANNLATSLFDLEENTNYDIKIDLYNSSGSLVDENITSLRTKKEWTLPSTTRTISVSNNVQLQNSINDLQAGDKIVLQPGIYSGFSISNKNFANSNGVVFTSADLLNRSIIHGSISVTGSANITFYGLRVENGATIFGLRGNNYISIVNNLITDYSGADSGYLAGMISISHSEESPLGKAIGGNLIMDNYIADLDHGAFEIVGQADRQTYYGIKQNYGVGGFTTIRNNIITGVADAISPGGDEGVSPLLYEDDTNVLDTWPNQEIDIYDNILYNTSDDCIETDGHMTNGRIFSNII